MQSNESDNGIPEEVQEFEELDKELADMQELAQIPDESNIIYQHAVAFYDILHNAGNDEPLSDDRVVRVFRGKIVEKFRELEISNAYYTPVRKVLIESGSMKQVAQGARNSPTIMILFHPPVASEVNGILSSTIDLTSKIDLATLSQSVKDLQEQVGSIRITDALLVFETRLSELEKIVEELQTYIAQLKQPMPKLRA